MKCALFIYIFFMSLLLIIAEAELNENESCVATRIAEEQCGDHTYKAVRPLLKYIHQMKEESENNNNRIEGKDKEIRQLQEKLNQRNERVIEELTAQNEFYKQTIKEITSKFLSIKEEIGKLNSNPLKVQDCEEQQEAQKKSIDERDQKISNIKNEVNICAKKLKSCVEKPDCDSLTTIPDGPDIHKVKPDQEDPFNVLYDNTTAGPSWSVIQQRINGKEDFYRDWATYRNGFGAFDGDFFLGLEKIHRLTSAQPHELYIHMEGFDDDFEYYRYEQFAIAGEDDQYRLITLGKGEGNADNILDEHRNMQFSTFDRDNDNWTYDNCASKNNYGGGWWYSNCVGCNFNGKYYQYAASRDDAIFWLCYSSLKTVKMLIRPKSY